MPETNEFGEHIVPSVALEPYTLIFDLERQRPVIRVQGILPLPIGAEIELPEPNLSAAVVQVRLVAGNEGMAAALCLDVRIPPAYWGERDEMMEEAVAEAEETVADAREAVAESRESLAEQLEIVVE
jgi:hypothetical protein